MADWPLILSGQTNLALYFIYRAILQGFLQDLGGVCLGGVGPVGPPLLDNLVVSIMKASIIQILGSV